jgi:hypothetical protein
VATDPLESLQRLVDELGEAIDRPVDLEDGELHVLAYSAHEGEVDAVRRRSILARSSPKEVDDWMRAHGIHAATGPLRLPAAAELDMQPRVCVPVRDALGLLGFLWLVDAPERPVTDAEIATSAEVAMACAPILRSWRRSTDEDRARHHALLGSAFAGDPAGLAQLHAMGVLVATRHAAVLCAAFPETPAEATLVDLAGRARRLVASRHALDAPAGGDELVLFVALGAPGELDEVGGRLAALTGTAVGASEPQDTATIDLPHALREARAAARVAGRRATQPPFARFGATGVDGTLALLPATALADLAASPALLRLQDHDGDGALRHTLLAWLDHGGDATAAAEELVLHRATLYARLKRIESVAEVALDDGDTRLSLHLALRAVRLRDG